MDGVNERKGEAAGDCVCCDDVGWFDAEVLVTFVVPVQLRVLACMLRNEVWEVVAVVSVISSFR